MTIADIERTILLARMCDEQRNEERLEPRADVAATTHHHADFIARYVNQLPRSLSATEMGLRALELENTVEPILNTIESFFTTGCELSQQGGLAALLDRAYLGHRLLEELNDHLHVRTGTWVLHTDMTEANVQVHQLLGEPYASELDNIVLQVMDAFSHALSIQPEVPTFDNAIETMKPFAVSGDQRLK